MDRAAIEQEIAVSGMEQTIQSKSPHSQYLSEPLEAQTCPETVFSNAMANTKDIGRGATVQTEQSSDQTDIVEAEGNNLNEPAYFTEVKEHSQMQFTQSQVQTSQSIQDGSFNLDTLPPPPVISSDNHQEQQAVYNQQTYAQYYTQLSSVGSETILSSSTVSDYSQSTPQNAPMTPGASNTLEHSSEQVSSSNAPSQAFITHYPHQTFGNGLDMTRNLEISHATNHIVHHRPNNNVDHYQHMTIQHQSTDAENMLVQAHAHNLELTPQDVLLQQPAVYDPARNIYLTYQNPSIEHTEQSNLHVVHNPMQQAMHHSGIPHVAKIEDPGVAYTANRPQSASMQMRSRKRDVEKREEPEVDGFDSVQGAPEKCIEDILKGTPGNEHRKKKIEALLK